MVGVHNTVIFLIYINCLPVYLNYYILFNSSGSDVLWFPVDVLNIAYISHPIFLQLLFMSSLKFEPCNSRQCTMIHWSLNPKKSLLVRGRKGQRCKWSKKEVCSIPAFVNGLVYNFNDVAVNDITCYLDEACAVKRCILNGSGMSNFGIYRRGKVLTDMARINNKTRFKCSAYA
jgi:hypothetical protein